jgi:hypothetical protein
VQLANSDMLFVCYQHTAPPCVSACVYDCTTFKLQLYVAAYLQGYMSAPAQDQGAPVGDAKQFVGKGLLPLVQVQVRALPVALGSALLSLRCCTCNQHTACVESVLHHLLLLVGSACTFQQMSMRLQNRVLGAVHLRQPIALLVVIPTSDTSVSSA